VRSIRSRINTLLLERDLEDVRPNSLMTESTKDNRNGGSRRLALAAIAIFFAIAAATAANILRPEWLWRNRSTKSSTTTMAPVRGPESSARPVGKTPQVAPLIPMPELERRIVAGLEQSFPAGERGAEKMTLRDAVARIAKQIPVPVDFDSKVLDDASVDLSIQVELPRGNRSVGSVLDAVLYASSQPLTWIVRDEALTITTDETANMTRDTRVYDLTDLADRVVTRDGVKWLDVGPLTGVLRRSFPDLAEGYFLFATMNVADRALLVANLSRKEHQDVAAALTGIRRVLENGDPVRSDAGPRRVSEKPGTKVPSAPLKASKGELAALEHLSKNAPTGVAPPRG
jgi:hypothetical protein